MIRGARYAYVALAWAFVAALLVQTLFIGLGLFGESDFREVHVSVGWILHLVPVLIVIAAAVARVGRSRLLWTVALLAVVFVFPILPGIAREMGAPVVAALHPVGALLAFWIAIVVARQATSALGEADVADAPTTVPAA
jgi:Family of unknown function (DUF6220)